MKPYLLYYVHAHGSGHITSFKLVYPELSKYFEVVAVTTNSKATSALATLPGLAVTELPLKWAAASQPPPHTFSRAFEETPYSNQPAERIARLLTLIQTYRPVAFICDGSPELAIAARSMGTRIVLGHLPGNVMADPTQVFAYELADSILAYFPKSIQASGYRYANKTYYSGFMSGYALNTANATSHGTDITIILGNDNYSESLLQTMTSDTSRSFTIIGNHKLYNLSNNCTQRGRIADISVAIAGDIVVSAAGQNTVAELLTLEKTVILLPEPRPYDEQLSNATWLQNHGATLLAGENFTAKEWSALYDRATTFVPNVKGLVNHNAPAEIAHKMKELYATF